MSNLSSTHTGQVLACLQCQGASNDCGPYTTATVINALCGQSLQADQLAKVMNRPAWRGFLPVIRRIPNWATLPWGMVDVFRQYGLTARWRFLAHESQLKQGLESGDVLMPVTGTWRPLAAHVMTLLDWDEQAHRLGFANTQYPTQNLYWWDEQEFLKRWKAMGRLLVWVKTG